MPTKLPRAVRAPDQCAMRGPRSCHCAAGRRPPLSSGRWCCPWPQSVALTWTRRHGRLPAWGLACSRQGWCALRFVAVRLESIQGTRWKERLGSEGKSTLDIHSCISFCGTTQQCSAFLYFTITFRSWPAAVQGLLNHGVEVAEYLREIGCDQVWRQLIHRLVWGQHCCRSAQFQASQPCQMMHTCLGYY